MFFLYIICNFALSKNRKIYNKIVVDMMSKYRHGFKAIAAILLLVVFSAVAVNAQSHTDGKSEKELKALAKKGNPEDQKNLGVYYANQRRFKEAREWFMKAANQYYAPAQNCLGIMHERGNGVEKDFRTAESWYKKAANQNYNFAQYNLAHLYEFELKDTNSASMWYHRAANNGSEDAQAKLGEMYMTGKYVRKDEKTASRWYHEAVKEACNCEVYYNLGLIYASAQTIERNLDSAIYWFRKSAACGYDEAIKNLTLYEKNYGIESWRLGNYYERKQKYDLALYWYKKSADAGFSGSMLEIGNYYYFGYGVAIDYDKAFKWYSAAAKLDIRDAQLMVGYMYAVGQGSVKKDQKLAMYWYRKAALNGYPSTTAMRNMAVKYYNGYYEGKKLIQSYSDAFEWYHRAARSGADTIATEMVAYMYEMGLGVTKDKTKAQCWYTIAVNRGDQSSKISMERLGGRLWWSIREEFIYSKPQVEIVVESETTDETVQNVMVDVTSNRKIDSVVLYVNRQKIKHETIISSDTSCGIMKMSTYKVSLSPGKNVLRAVAYIKSGRTTSTVECTKYIECNATAVSSYEPTVVSTNTGAKETFSTQSFVSGKRIALVMGNTSYQGDKRLNNPGNDADAIAAKLSALGFDVMLKKDLDKKGIVDALAEFGVKAKGYDVSLFYYSGHGISVSGVNYLVPLGAYCPGQESVDYECVSLNQVLDYMSNSKMKIAMFDACRDNPFKRSWKTKGGSSRGFVQMNSPRGTLISFATAPGETASDGYRNHSPYASAVLEVLDIKGLSLGDFFQRVRHLVHKNTGGMQVTWESNSTVGDFYFNQ